MQGIPTLMAKVHRIMAVAPWFYLIYGVTGGTFALVGIAIQILRRPE